jgi:hypothetical protein
VIDSSKSSFVFHATLDIIIAKGATKPLCFKLVFTCGINCWMPSWKPIRANVSDNQYLSWISIKMKSWTCFGWNTYKNLDFVIICIIVSNQLPSIVNNIGSSLVAMEPQKNKIKIGLLILNDLHYMTIFTYFLKWKCNKANYG